MDYKIIKGFLFEFSKRKKINEKESIYKTLLKVDKQKANYEFLIADVC